MWSLHAIPLESLHIGEAKESSLKVEIVRFRRLNIGRRGNIYYFG